jgi:predicted Zn-dependent protease
MNPRIRSAAMSRRALTLAILAAAVATACATSPTGRRQLVLVSDDQMAQMGATAFQEMKQKTPPSQNGKQSSYVRCVANAVTAAMPGPARAWEVQLFEDKQVNAFALPGGKIGVYTGLLKVATTQDQLAAVIGHEVSHVIAGHSAARVSNQMATQVGVEALSAFTGYDPQMIGMGANLLVILPFSRGDETEADLLGMDAMARAGFDPAQAITLWQNMERAGGEAPPEILSTHPSNSTRIHDLQARLAQDQPIYQQAKAQGRTPQCR